MPPHLKEKRLKYQQNEAKNWSADNNFYTHPHGNESYEMIQAYRLYLLALANQPELGAMNRMREQPNISAIARWRLAGAYQLAGQGEIAEKLVSQLSTKVTAYRELSYSYGSAERDKAMILEVLTQLKRKNKASELVEELSRKLSSDEFMNTQETAYSLMAISQYYGLNAPPASARFSYTVNESKAVEVNEGKMTKLAFGDKKYGLKNKLKLVNKSKSSLFVKVIRKYIPLTDDRQDVEKNLKMRVSYFDMKGNALNPKKISQGTSFYAEIEIENPGKKGFYREMAINQIFPAGWEIHNTRMDGHEQSRAARYADVRDDRVYTYYDLGENQKKSFRVYLNASYLGKFYLPAVYSEAMYDHNIQARKGGQWVEVVKG